MSYRTLQIIAMYVNGVIDEECLLVLLPPHLTAPDAVEITEITITA